MSSYVLGYTTSFFTAIYNFYWFLSHQKEVNEALSNIDLAYKELEYYHKILKDPSDDLLRLLKFYKPINPRKYWRQFHLEEGSKENTCLNDLKNFYSRIMEEIREEGNKIKKGTHERLPEVVNEWSMTGLGIDDNYIYNWLLLKSFKVLEEDPSLRSKYDEKDEKPVVYGYDYMEFLEVLTRVWDGVVEERKDRRREMDGATR